MTSPKKTASGFTLVEILVVMSLMSLLMLALGSALRTIAQTEERIDERLTRSDEFRTTNQFVRDTLGRVLMVRSDVTAASGVAPLLFSGTEAAVQWMGIMPANHGIGGRFLFRLALEEVGAGQLFLVLRYSPWQGKNEFPDWRSTDFRVLSSRATSIALLYQDNAGAWTPAWVDPNQLPNRVQITLNTAIAAWPALVIPLRALSNRGGPGAFTIGGSN